MSKKQSVLIIGAGPGGLTAGMILQSRGFDVTILEKSDRVGGRNAAFEDAGFKFDIGPTFLIQKFSLDEMFHEVGREASDYLDFIKLDTIYRHQFTKDLSVDVTCDREKMANRLNEISDGGGDGYKKFMSREAKKFKSLFACLQRPYPTFLSNINKNTIKALPFVATTKSLFEEMGRYFDEDVLRLTFTFQAKYLGMSPWNCPSLFTIIPFIEHAFGVYHVKGGLSEISVAMAKVFEEQGGKLLLNSTVESIITDHKSINGVLTTNGQKHRADSYIINADFGYAMTNLIQPKGSIPKYDKEAMSKLEVSCSTFMLYLGIKGKVDLPVHTIYFADDYKKNVDEITANESPSADPSFYLRNASAVDDTLAPEGHSNIYVLVPTVNRRSGYDWKSNLKQYRDLVIDKIKERTPITDIEDRIVYEKIVTPDDWEHDFNVYEGAVFNLSHILKQMLSFRPRNNFPELDNCFLVGGGTHPGSGLPTIYESGRIAANYISDNAGIKYNKPPDVDIYLKDAGL